MNSRSSDFEYLNEPNSISLNLNFSLIHRTEIVSGEKSDENFAVCRALQK